MSTNFPFNEGKKVNLVLTGVIHDMENHFVHNVIQEG